MLTSIQALMNEVAKMSWPDIIRLVKEGEGHWAGLRLFPVCDLDAEYKSVKHSHLILCHFFPPLLQ